MPEMMQHESQSKGSRDPDRVPSPTCLSYAFQEALACRESVHTCLDRCPYKEIVDLGHGAIVGI